MQCMSDRTRLVRGWLVGAAFGLTLALPAAADAQVLRPTNRVAFVYDSRSLENNWHIRRAYDSALEEMGIRPVWKSTNDLALLSDSDLAYQFKAIVFPDTLAQTLPTVLGTRMTTYAQAGGNVLAIFDPGIRDANGFFMPDPVFKDLLGVDYFRYDELGVLAFLFGRVQFANQATARAWHIQPGRLDSSNSIVGYVYGQLRYPMTTSSVIAGDVVVAAAEGTSPVFSTRNVGAGKVMHVNAPVGYLKGRGDGLLLNAAIHTFFFDLCKLPRLIASPGGVGGMVMNWHVDSDVEHETLPRVHAAGLFRPSLAQDFTVTSGPDFQALGDGKGFAATTTGRPYLESIMPFGPIGSHGGWAHDWFAFSVLNGTLQEQDIAYYIALNGAALTEVTGQPVRSYAAPQGVHPQPTATKILEQQGVDGYYYVGDTGCPPTRTYWDGQMVSETTWAFPLSTYQNYASLYEFKLNRVRNADVLAWLKGLADFCAEDKTIRIMYSHPYDLIYQRYENMFNKFLDHCVELQNGGTLKLDGMSAYTRFLRRYVKTKFETYLDSTGKNIVVNLENPETLQDLAFELPAGSLKPGFSVPFGLQLRTDAKGNYVFKVTRDRRALSFQLPRP